MIPKWAAKVVEQDPRGIAEDSQHQRFIQVKGEAMKKQFEWASKKPVDFKANCVCAPCNNGWMERIEAAAMPIVTRMIQGGTISLSRDAQDIVAKWLALKAIVERHARSPIMPLRADWMEHFYEQQSPPATWQIRLARWVGDVVVYMAGGDFDFQIRDGLGPSTISHPGMLFTLGIGRFVGQIIGVDHQMAIPTERDLFVPIWPHPPLTLVDAETSRDDLVAWPPERWLNDADLERYSRDPAESVRH